MTTVTNLWKKDGGEESRRELAERLAKLVCAREDGGGNGAGYRMKRQKREEGA